MVEPQKLAETPSQQVSDWFLSKLGFYKPDILPETRSRFQLLQQTTSYVIFHCDSISYWLFPTSYEPPNLSITDVCGVDWKVIIFSYSIWDRT